MYKFYNVIERSAPQDHYAFYIFFVLVTRQHFVKNRQFFPVAQSWLFFENYANMDL